MDSESNGTVTRTFVVVTIAGSLVAWDIGFDVGAFDTVSYRRVLTVFIISTVVLITTLVRRDRAFMPAPIGRAILALPLVYLIADITFLTTAETVVQVLGVAIIATFPYTLYVIARLLDQDYFRLPRRERAIAAAVVISLGIAGLYVGHNNDRFLTCGDFERVGDYVPENCAP